MIRRPPRSTLFLHDALPISLGQWNGKEYARRVGYLPQDPDPAFPMRALDVVVSGRAPYLGRFAWETTSDFDRSEEHTSELQSQSNLVCRLLLEKKKTKISHK